MWFQVADSTLCCLDGSLELRIVPAGAGAGAGSDFAEAPSPESRCASSALSLCSCASSACLSARTSTVRGLTVRSCTLGRTFICLHQSRSSRATGLHQVAQQVHKRLTHVSIRCHLFVQTLNSEQICSSQHTLAAEPPGRCTKERKVHRQLDANRAVSAQPVLSSETLAEPCVRGRAEAQRHHIEWRTEAYPENVEGIMVARQLCGRNACSVQQGQSKRGHKGTTVARGHPAHV